MRSHKVIGFRRKLKRRTYFCNYITLHNALQEKKITKKQKLLSREGSASERKNILNAQFENFFVYMIDQIPAIVSKLEPGAQSKLVHTYYISPI